MSPSHPGSPRIKNVRPVEERFWEKVSKGSDDECWIWDGALSKAGYGTFNRGRRGDGYALAHRFAYEQLVGPIPDGLHLDHLCRDTRCVNPAHLEPVTSRENLLRGELGESQRTNLCVRGHDLTIHAYVAPNGRRSCRECKRERIAGTAEITEKQLQKQVIDLARVLGWRVAHFRAAMTAKGWRTPVEADGAGFPDLVLTRERSVFIELKTAKGKLGPEQVEWLRALRNAGAEAYVVRPRHLEAIAQVLQHRGTVSIVTALNDELDRELGKKAA